MRVRLGRPSLEDLDPAPQVRGAAGEEGLLLGVLGDGLERRLTDRGDEAVDDVGALGELQVDGRAAHPLERDLCLFTQVLRNQVSSAGE